MALFADYRLVPIFQQGRMALIVKDDDTEQRAHVGCPLSVAICGRRPAF